MASKTIVTCDLCEKDITYDPKFSSEMNIYHKKTDDTTVSINLTITVSDYDVKDLCKQCYADIVAEASKKLGIQFL